MLDKRKLQIRQFSCRFDFVLGLACVIPAQTANLPNSQELMQWLGVNQQEIAALDNGKAVSFEVAEGNENELAVGVTMHVPAATSKIIQLINKKSLMVIRSFETYPIGIFQSACPA